MAKKQVRTLSLLFALLLTCWSCLALPTVAGAAEWTSDCTSAADWDHTGLPFGASDSVPTASTCFSQTELSRLRVCLGGMPFGVKFMTDGIFVVGFSDVDTSSGSSNPARSAGLKIGDTILRADGTPLESAAELTSLVENGEGRAITLSCSRNGNAFECRLIPSYSKQEKRYKTGLYVRDSGAGIGTVTFILPQTQAFCGLGHGICDGESGALIPIERGSVVDVTINGLVKGLSGSPGEVKGYFSSGKTGTLLGNTHCGVYGVLAKLPALASASGTVPVAHRTELTEGKAYLCASLDGNTVKQYEVEISNIQRDSQSNKCFTVHVTDPELISKTGGIIQGMSGSPLLQNGKLVGAVTHVLINDPTTGYGIFIENMLNQMGDMIR
ncbi:MAG: SpoIVB peptidase [Clostridia bacterium]|nr:SpoIVB peptidase [Clostridia bacterium]